MAKTKTSNAVKQRYIAKTYARLGITIPKSRKEQLEEYAKAHYGSVNGMINKLIREEMGISEKEWKDYLKDTDNSHEE
ncbi:MAG: hypothetical protein IJC56_10280 [Clostridia bacterium]|nr:hypothetical protein [Clostridia bacterium]